MTSESGRSRLQRLRSAWVALAVLCRGVWGWRLLLLVVGVALGVLQSARCFDFLAAHGMGGPIGFGGEVGSLATYGKWWVFPPHNYMTDGFSGEMPTYYNYLSDSLINVLARLGDWPSLTVQIAFYGPLLAMLFFWGNVASLRLVTGKRAASLIGALLLSLTASSGLLGLLFDPGVVETVKAYLHVPAIALVFGTSQSLGWVLFLPALATFYAAQEAFTRRRAVVCGLLTGLLPHIHTLTLINVAFGQLACATAMNTLQLPAGRRRQIWLVGLSLVGLAFAAHVTVARISTPILAGYAALALLLNFAVSRDWRPYVWIYGIATIVASPYALTLFGGRGPTALLAEVGGPTIPPAQVVVFYAAHIAAALLALRSQIPRSVLAFFVSLLAVTACLSYNGSWGWNNHPYRFAIHLVFPLCGLAALGLTRGSRPWAFLAGAWLGVMVAGNIVDQASRWRGRGQIEGLGDSAATFLPVVRDVTAESPLESRLLNFPEYGYPTGSHLNTQLLSFSRRPGFIPDYRYLLDRGRYFNRLGVFCFLFPGYPAEDWHLGGRRACDETLSPPADLVSIREPRLRAAIVSLYGLSLAASLAPPYSAALAQAEVQYDWELLLNRGVRRRLVRLHPPSLPGLARLRRLRETPGVQVVPFDVSSAGDQVFVLGGRSLRERVSRIRIDGRNCPAGEWRDNWVVFQASLGEGPHELQLEGPGRDPGGEREVLYFVAIVERRLAPNYLELGDSLR